jgi:hypothetical protein
MNVTELPSQIPIELAEAYKEKVQGILHVFDRIIITGTIPEICYPQAMSSWLWQRDVRLFDFPTTVAKGWRDQIHKNAEELAKAHDVAIHLIQAHWDKEEYVRKALGKQQPLKEGLVLILKVMEGCQKYRPCWDSQRQCYLKMERGRCMTFYFYINDPQWGICWFRLPSWAPFKMQVYLNGHHRLRIQMERAGIEFTALDNSFVNVGDLQKAQKLADRLDVKGLHRKLDRWAREFCPVLKEMTRPSHWSLWQLEYATDVIFQSPEALAPIYQQIVKESINTVKARDVATFLGRRLTQRFDQEAGSRLTARQEGTRIRHELGPAAIKMYDKFARILRIETVLNDVSFMTTFRKVTHRDGSSELKYAAVRKSLYSLQPLRGLMRRSNQRYYQYISSLTEQSRGVIELAKLSAPVRDRNNRLYRGFNLFDESDAALLSALLQGEYKISGLTNRRLRRLLPGWSASKISRSLKRLRNHGVIKKVGRRYKYYLTARGQNVLTTLLALKEHLIIPQLASP